MKISVYNNIKFIKINKLLCNVNLNKKIKYRLFLKSKLILTNSKLNTLVKNTIFNNIFKSKKNNITNGKLTRLLYTKVMIFFIKRQLFLLKKQNILSNKKNLVNYSIKTKTQNLLLNKNELKFCIVFLKYLVSKKVLKSKNIQMNLLKLIKNKLFFSKKIKKFIFNKLILSKLNRKKKSKFNFKPNLKNVFFIKLVNSFLKKGSKTKAYHLVKNCFNNIYNASKKPIENTLNILQKRLKVSIEVKKVKSRRSTHLVPFPVNNKRKIYLITKWISNGVKKIKKFKKFKNTTSKALEIEIMYTILKKSNSYKFKKYSIKNAIQNRSNAHFRW